jgi:hypothetical protein
MRKSCLIILRGLGVPRFVQQLGHTFAVQGVPMVTVSESDIGAAAAKFVRASKRHLYVFVFPPALSQLARLCLIAWFVYLGWID